MAASTIAALPSTVEGTLTFRRRLSAKLTFYDLEAAADRDPVELILKADGPGNLSLAEVKELKADLHLGDRVRVAGREEVHEGGGGGRCLHVCKVEVLGRWKDERPGQHFVPRKITSRAAPSAAPRSTEHEEAGAGAGVAGGGEEEKEQEGSAGSQSAGGVCKYWINTGSCPRGDNCAFLHGVRSPTAHPGSSEAHQAAVAAARASWVLQRKKARRELAGEKGDPHAASSASKSQRAEIFASFLVEKFGAEALSAGTGVLDVAGGRGNVSFALYTQRGIQCTLIDPRPQRLNKKQCRAIKGGGEAGRGACEQIQEEFGPDLWAAGEFKAKLQGCSAVVGMHPDEATEAIVDFALQHGKPFACVPCCVFPKLFPRVLEGEPVVLHAQLVEWLRVKGGGQVEFLPFEGQNQVVWSRGRSGGSTIGRGPGPSAGAGAGAAAAAAAAAGEDDRVLDEEK